MYKCRDIEKNADNYQDKYLSFIERMSFKFHLLMCSSCRLYINQFSTMVKMLKNISIPREENVSNIVNKLKLHITKGENHEK